MLLEKVERAILGDALISAGDRGAVALSGGQDSLCLLHLLVGLRSTLGLTLEALVVDHGLRPGSADAAKRAAALSDQLGVDAVILQAKVPTDRGNVQQAAREERLGLLGEHARQRGLRWVALGHTATDQAETVLMRMIRGTGPRGLGGIACRRPPFIRPMLEVTREEVGRYLARHRLSPVIDPTNATDHFLRNRIRHRVLPLLERENPKVIDALCRLARSCREEDEALDQQARVILGRACARESRALDAAELKDLPRGILHRVLRLKYEEVAGPWVQLGRQHLEAIAQLLGSPAGTRGIDLPGGTRVERQYDRLCWHRSSARAAAVFEPVDLVGPGVVALSDGRSLLLEVVAGGGLDLGQVRFPLHARPPLPGDRIAIDGGHTRKVARVLMDAKIPRDSRRHVPVVLYRDVVVMIAGVRVAHGYGAKGEVPGLVVHIGV
jgi:tRNA(Ile)-lysidine synthase